MRQAQAPPPTAPQPKSPSPLQRDRMAPLPALVLSAVFAHLTWRDVARAAGVCHGWAVAARPVLYASLAVWQSRRNPPIGPCASDLETLKYLATDTSVPEVQQGVLGYVRYLDLYHNDISVCEYIALRLRPSTLKLTYSITVDELVAALQPIGANVSHLSVRGQDSDADKIASLFPGRLLQLDSDSVGKVLLARNLSSLRILSIVDWQHSAIPALVDFFGSNPPLHVLSLRNGNLADIPSVLQAIKTGCSRTLTQFSMSYPLVRDEGEILDADLLLSIVSGLPKLEHLTLTLGYALGKSISTPAPTVWPPITTLRLHIYSTAILKILAGVASTIKSLRLDFLYTAEILSHEALRLALKDVDATCFPHLRNLQLVEWRKRTKIAATELEEMVTFFPRLETLELYASLESLRPLGALASLRRLNVQKFLWSSSSLIAEAADLILQRDCSDAAAKVLRVFLCDDWYGGEEWAALAASDAASAATSHTGDRLQFVLRGCDMPTYF
ncbi:hypothetical protein HK405_005659 [Cladochytrium tenue]|nr:hypothetical protein HK405_005659 [Cladochytrium tenue]